MIQETLKMIEEQIGLKLSTNDTKITRRKGKKYFNVNLRGNSFDCKEYNKLERFALKYNSISVEPNGRNKVAICINK